MCAGVGGGAVESNFLSEWEQAEPQETQQELRVLTVPSWTSGGGGHVTENADIITVARVLDRWTSTRESGTWSH